METEVTTTTRHPRFALQCGHGPKAVETGYYLEYTDGRVRLQCGHGPKAVETRVPLPPVAQAILALQCGHGPKAVETRRRHASGGGAARSFNAATARRPWRPTGRR